MNFKNIVTDKKYLLIGGTLFLTLLTASFFVFQHRASQEESSSAKTEQPTKNLPLATHLATTYQDDLPGLLRKRYIRVLTTLNRTNFFISEGHMVGYEYDMLKAYESHLNKQLNKKDLRIVLDFIPVNRDELVRKLVEGYGDIAAAGLTITSERKKKIAFTIPYRNDIREVIVSNKQGFDPDSLEDLAGKTVYVRQSSSYHRSLLAVNSQFEKKGLKPVHIKDIAESIETESILEMVNSGAINLTVADDHIAMAWEKSLPDIVVHEDIAVRKGGKIAWMVRKDNPKLLASLNEFLRSHKQGTRLGNIYFERYYATSKLLQNPTNPENWNKLKKYKALIQKYSAKYDFDWLLVLAMAFQESGLDHTKKSHAGAVGVMQIRPSTARDKNIGIEDVQNLDNNIHAGTKYLAFLRDKYFSDPSIRPRDRIRFALASYNAGPAKIRKAREEAKRMGRNPNRWFRNVEMAVLKTVGQETVRYVSNINKYYILYSNIFEK